MSHTISIFQIHAVAMYIHIQMRIKSHHAALHYVISYSTVLWHGEVKDTRRN